MKCDILLGVVHLQNTERWENSSDVKILMYTAHSKMNVCLQIKNLEMFCGETVSRKSCIFKFCSLEQTRIKEMLCVVA